MKRINIAELPFAAEREILQTPLSIRMLCRLVLFILVGCSNVFAVAQMESGDVEDSLFTDHSGAGSTAASLAEHPDSLQLRLLEIEIAKAQIQVSQTNLWHRLIPQFHFSGSLALKDIFFVDPSSFIPYIVPRDAYRLTATVSVTDILDGSKHSRAELDLEKLRVEFERLKQQQARQRSNLRRRRAELNDLFTMLREELKMKEDVVKFNDLRFQQGNIDYDALVRSRLDVLNVRKNICRFRRDIYEIQTILPDSLQP